MGGAAWLILVTSPWLDGPLRAWSQTWGRQSLPARFWGEAAYWAGLGAVQGGALVLWALVLWRRGRRPAAQPAWLGLAAVILSGLGAQVIKRLSGRPRPHLHMHTWSLTGPAWDSDYHSFPSGHATTSFALAVVLSARFPRLSWLFYLLASLVAAGRVVSSSHFAGDVAAGALLGILVGFGLVRWAGRRGEAQR